MKERLRKVRGNISAVQEHFMQKQVAVWKFQNEQHNWLQLVFQKLSDALGYVETPVFPSWVIRTEGQEEEEEKEDSNEKEEEEKEEEPVKRKRVTRKQMKGKKKTVIESDVEELYDTYTEEDQEAQIVVKEMEKDEEEEDSDSEEESEEDNAKEGVDMVEIARQKYAKTPPPIQQETTHLSPVTSPVSSHTHSLPKETPSHPNSPIPSLHEPQNQSPPPTTPPPPSTQPEVELEPLQHDQTIEDPSPNTTEPQTKQPIPSSPSNIIANVVSTLEKENLQVNEEEPEE